jgi:release factor glutamine methyltransferase
LSAAIIGEALRGAEARLRASGTESPRREAALLLCMALDRPRSHVIAWPERRLEPAQLMHFRSLVERRCAGEPIAYITGERAFWTFQVRVTPDTLIPRPETELVVERALSHIPPRAKLRIADLGTGSGALAAAVAMERPRCRIVATDVSRRALAVARDNLVRLGLARVETRPGEWCAALPAAEAFDLILSNPPYVPEGDPHLSRGDAAREPRTALAAGPDGLDAIRRIAACAPAHMAAGGWLLLEHGFDQGEAVRRILRAQGLERIRTHRDLAGLERVTEGRLSPEAS